jgi:uncharacterized delta-60 repeat protein
MKLLFRRLRILFLAGMAAFAASASARPGDLDLRFNPLGSGSPPGTVRLQLHNASTDLDKMVLLPGGEILGLVSADRVFLARWLPDGSLNPSFGNGGLLPVDTGLLGTLGPMAVQPDGKILLASGASAVARKILRLMPDGMPDPSFGTGGAATVNFPGGSGYAYTMVLQSDGKILIGGGGFSAGAYVPCLLRFLPDGGEDQTFGAAGTLVLEGFEGGIRQLAVQPGGEIVMAGHTFFDGALQAWLGRCDTAGIPDPAFGDAGIRRILTMHHASDGSLRLALQSDGKILIAGDTLNQLSPVVVYLERYNQDGSPDTSFNGSGRAQPGTPFGFTVVKGLFPQSDGKLIVGGFANLHLSVARFLEDGTPDTGFGTGGLAEVSLPFGWGVYTLLQQQDGKFVSGGGMWDAASSRYSTVLTRFTDRSLTESLSGEWPAGTVLPNGGTVQLTTVRGAVSPQETTITLRNTGPVPLTNLSARLSGAGSDHFTLVSPPPPVLDSGGTATLNVRFSPEQQVSGFGAVLEIDSGDPGIENLMIILRGSTVSAVATLELLNDTQSLPANGVLDFGATIAAKPLTRALTLKNTGNIELQILQISFGSSGTPEDFTAGLPETDRLLPGESTTFPVTFTPSGPGARTAKLRIASTDTFNLPLEINLTGRGAEGLDAWRLTFFDTLLNEGPAADLSDPDHDGIPNLLEYATLTSPIQPGAPSVQLIVKGSTLEYSFVRPSSASLHLSCRLEFTDSLNNQWIPAPGDPVIIEDDGTRQRVTFSLPAGDQGHRFVRLRVLKR